MTLRLVIADPEPIVRAGLRGILTVGETDIVAETDRLAPLPDLIHHYSPRVLLLETAFPDGDGITAIKKIRRDGFDGRILFFSSSSDQVTLRRAEVSGANAYLLKSTPVEELERSLRVWTGLRPIAPLTPRFPCVRDSHQHATGIDEWNERFTKHIAKSPLTHREIEILLHVARGEGNKEIATILKISVDTVKEHIGNIIRKLGALDRTSAVAIALRGKIIT